MRQKYSTVNMFPIRCFSFKAPKELTESTLEKVNSLEYRCYNGDGGVGTSLDIHKNPDFYDLHEWFQRCVDSLHVDNGWSCDRIVVNKSWVNRSDAETGHHHTPHRHPMSWLSGIYYLTDGAPTIFVDPLSQREWAQFHVDGGPITDATQYIQPQPGGLFVFPSYMIHSTDPNFEACNRFSIAFNTFPSGALNFGGWDQAMAKVQVEGWADLGPLNLSDYS